MLSAGRHLAAICAMISAELLVSFCFTQKGSRPQSAVTAGLETHDKQIQLQYQQVSKHMISKWLIAQLWYTPFIMISFNLPE